MCFQCLFVLVISVWVHIIFRRHLVQLQNDGYFSDRIFGSECGYQIHIECFP